MQLTGFSHKRLGMPWRLVVWLTKLAHLSLNSNEKKIQGYMPVTGGIVFVKKAKSQENLVGHPSLDVGSRGLIRFRNSP